MSAVRRFAVALGVALLAGCAQAPAPRSGPVNVAEFGAAFVLRSESALPVYTPALTDSRAQVPIDIAPGQIIQLDWREPRDVRQVTLTGPLLPSPDRVRIEYWHRIWPDNGTGGWQKLDDPFNGRFVAARATPTLRAGSITYTLDPLEKAENPSVRQTGFPYRRTYRIRAVFDAPAKISQIEAYTGAVWKTAAIRVHRHPTAKHPELWECLVEARNGRVLSVSPRLPSRKPVTVTVNYADVADRLSSDRAALIFRSEGFSGFSVFVDDVIREGALYVRDIDAFVSDASHGIRYKDWAGPEDCWDATVMQKVAQLPEQSLAGVARAIPAKPAREAHLGLPNMRQEFTIQPNGDVVLLEEALRCAGPDRDRRPWTDREIRFHISTESEPNARRVARRYLENGHLPVIHTEWSTGPIEYHQAAFATLLRGDLADTESKLTGCEPLVLLNRIELRNTDNNPQTAQVWLSVAPHRPFRLGDGGMVVLDVPSDGKARPGLTPIRGLIQTNGRGALRHVADRNAIHYTVELAPGQSHSIALAIPYIELLDASEQGALAGLRFEREHERVVAFWNERLGRGMSYDVPEPILNDLFKANLWHVLITNDRDPTTGLYQHGAATMHYKNYPNETCMVAQSLEMRGEHAEARRLLEPFLAGQGVKPLPGRFTDKTGLFYSTHPVADPDPYTSQGYNMHHGWMLWALAEHWKWTRDPQYLERIAPKLIEACQWIKRQRDSMKANNPDGTRPLEYGLAPAGDLEDVEEYLYWYATNGYYYAGLAAADEVLGKAGYPEALRIGYEAECYRQDILESLRQATAASPVVRLRDGTYVPYVPSRAYVYTHLKEGWIREALYPALHLLDAGVVDSDHPIVSWLLNDLEDNIFLSKESGYGVMDAAANFFHFGGFTLQPNLLPNAMAHLRRDEVPHFLRVFYNTLHASLYPDTVCFAEWVKYYGSGNGPLYKTPDECKFVQLMRNMLILEQGRTVRTLRLGTGVPRAWMTDGKTIRVQRAATFYGPMDLTIRSQVAQDRITARINLPRREPADVVLLRLRHPEGRQFKKVTVNGLEWKQLTPSLELIVLPGALEQVEVVAWY